MRILLTTDTVGGVWTFTRELAAGLLAAGHDVALVSFGREPLPEHEAWVNGIQAAWDQPFLFLASDAPLEWMEENHRTLEGEPALRRIVGQFRPDIVHVSQFCWGALDLGVPIVVTAHSDVLSWADVCRPGGLEPSDWLQRYVALTTQGLAGAALVTAPTQWMLEALRPHYTIDHPTQVIPNGRDLASSTTEPGFRELRAITAGRLWDEGKGTGLLAEGGWPLPVVVAGESSFEQGTAIFPGVRSLGRLDENALLAAFRASAFYLCPSVYEPFGLAALEAALCGCIVICRDIPSLREVWGDDAIYFTDGEDLRAALHTYADDARLRAKMQHQAGERASRYSRGRMVQGYLGAYEQALRRASPAAQEVGHA